MMRPIILKSLLSLSLIWLAACAATQLPATVTIRPTDTPSPPSTPLPKPVTVLTDTPEPTPTPMPTPTPEVWEIWFSGFSCEGLTLCVNGPDDPFYSYSIMSDGSDFKQLTLTSLPPPLALPEGVPTLEHRSSLPDLSPNGDEVAYGTGPSLYIVNLHTAQVNRIFQMTEPTDTLIWIGPACWSRDGLTLEFLVKSSQGNSEAIYTVHTIDKQGLNHEELLTLPSRGFVGTVKPICSPDGQEMAFSTGLIVPATTGLIDPATNGIVVVNLNTGELRQILYAFYVGWFRNASASP